MTTWASTDLLRASHCWPNAIHVSLWHATKKNYSNLIKSIPTNFKPETYHGRIKISANYDSSLLTRFSGYKVESKLDHLHTFGFPVYVLENSLHSSKSHNKWIYRSTSPCFQCTHCDQHTDWKRFPSISLCLIYLIRNLQKGCKF